jgi:hypothetical protein
MEKIKKYLPHPPFLILKWFFLILISVYVLAMIIRLPFFLQNKNTAEQVIKIHETKLTLDDVMGKNLPPDPGINADKTIAGIDANNNGIRDDVELAVFKEYPSSAKTRAVLLQYALALQMEFTLPVLNTDTATAIIEDNNIRAHICIWSISSRSDMEKFTIETDKNEHFVENLQFNNDQRKKAEENFYKYVRSYSASNKGCDLDLSTLPN